jgi:hypothetical protein
VLKKVDLGNLPRAQGMFAGSQPLKKRAFKPPSFVCKTRREECDHFQNKTSSAQDMPEPAEESERDSNRASVLAKAPAAKRRRLLVCPALCQPDLQLSTVKADKIKVRAYPVPRQIVITS